MKLRMMMIALALLLPLTASATHWEAVTLAPDCEGWSLDAEIYWRSGVYEGEVSYVIELLDGDSNVLETQQWTGTVTREMNPQTYSFDGEWTVVAPAGNYVASFSVRIVAPYGDGLVDDFTEEGSEAFSCGTVANEATTWSAVKALY
jgi:hypothetical protein